MSLETWHKMAYLQEKKIIKRYQQTKKLFVNRDLMPALLKIDVKLLKGVRRKK